MGTPHFMMQKSKQGEEATINGGAAASTHTGYQCQNAAADTPVQSAGGFCNGCSANHCICQCGYCKRVETVENQRASGSASSADSLIDRLRQAASAWQEEAGRMRAAAAPAVAAAAAGPIQSPPLDLPVSTTQHEGEINGQDQPQKWCSCRYVYEGHQCHKTAVNSLIFTSFITSHIIRTMSLVDELWTPRNADRSGTRVGCQLQSLDLVVPRADIV